jgi:hypothetical protein
MPPTNMTKTTRWLPYRFHTQDGNALIQAIPEKKRLSETAFPVGSDSDNELRWFTPVTEVDLCGQATLYMTGTLRIPDALYIECSSLSCISWFTTTPATR